MPASILIADDEPAIADTLAYVLAREGYRPHSVGLGRLALEAIAADVNGEYALLILDVGLPDISGFDVCRELRRTSELPVIFLTARSDEVDRIVGLELGADDYVAKPFSPREVVSRVRAILRRMRPAPAPGLAPVAPSALAAVEAIRSSPPFEVDAEGMRIAWRGVWLSLTRYEYGLLAALIERPGRVLSRSRLMELVWRDADESFERTVDAHIKTLRGKLRAVANGFGDDDPIETHRGQGYSLRRDGR